MDEMTVNGFITNLCCRELCVYDRMAEPQKRTTLPASGNFEFPVDFEPKGEVIGRLNGFFVLQDALHKFDDADREAAEALGGLAWPQLNKKRRVDDYFVVPRLAAMHAVLRREDVAPYLLIPASPVYDGETFLGVQAFVPVKVML